MCLLVWLTRSSTDRLNRDIMLENILFTASGLLAIATGIVAYGLAICGVITMASAGTALSVAMGIGIVIAIVVGILAAIDADRERDVSLPYHIPAAIYRGLLCLTLILHGSRNSATQLENWPTRE